MKTLENICKAFNLKIVYAIHTLEWKRVNCKKKSSSTQFLNANFYGKMYI